MTDHPSCSSKHCFLYLRPLSGQTGKWQVPFLRCVSSGLCWDLFYFGWCHGLPNPIHLSVFASLTSVCFWLWPRTNFLTSLKLSFLTCKAVLVGLNFPGWEIFMWRNGPYCITLSCALSPVPVLRRFSWLWPLGPCAHLKILKKMLSRDFVWCPTIWIKQECRGLILFRYSVWCLKM